jgi:hypothetical protein
MIKWSIWAISFPVKRLIQNLPFKPFPLGLLFFSWIKSLFVAAVTLETVFKMTKIMS